MSFFPPSTSYHESCLKSNSKFSELLDRIVYLGIHHMVPCYCFSNGYLEVLFQNVLVCNFCIHVNQLECKFLVIRADILQLILESCSKPHNLLTHSFPQQIFIEFLLAIKSCNRC